jgi:hypothetical protein
MNTNLTPDPHPSPAPQPKKKKSKPSAFADVLRQWDSLLTAVADHATEIPSLEPRRAALAETLEKARTAKGLQESHAASRQTSTQSLQEILVEGKDRAIQLRGAIRAELGPTTEQLNQFGIRPIRRRPLRHKSTPAPAPALQPELQAGKGSWSRSDG